MDFKLTEEHDMMRKMVREFALKEVAPTAAERDEEERFDRGIFDKMGELGLTGIPWPEEEGGSGADYLSYAIAVEELSRVCASTGVTLSAHISLAGWPLHTFATPEQKQTFLRPMAEGKKLGVRLDRTRVRVRRSGYADDGGTRRRQLRAQRYENFYDKRRRSGNVHRLRRHRP